MQHVSKCSHLLAADLRIYRMDPSAELPRQTRAAVNSPVARLRAGAGDRELGGPEGEGILLRGSRAYKPSPGKPGLYDDTTYFEGQYGSQMAREAAAEPSRQGTTAELDVRNPLRKQYRTRD